MGKLAVGIAVGVAMVACTVAGIAVTRRVISRRRWNRALVILNELEGMCQTPVTRLRMLVDALAVEMHAGLASEGGSKLKMLLSFVDRLPTGNETGSYYAVEVSGAFLVMLRVHVGGAPSSLSWNMSKREIPYCLLSSTTEEFFDFVAYSLSQFVEDEDYFNGEELKLGFTFSFPVKQSSVNSGKLIKWTKGFSIADTVGRDVGECLQVALSKQGLRMRVAALVNDTVATLAFGHFHDADTVAALIVGQGTNACYFERADAIIKSQGLFSQSKGSAVNMEWGSFWSSHLPRTCYDEEDDVGFEKLISGDYIGEVVRKAILTMGRESDQLGRVSPKLASPFSLGWRMVALMHEDETEVLERVGEVIEEEMEMGKVGEKGRKVVVRVCDVVVRRAARLTAAGVVGILKKMGRGRGETRSVVAVEGDLYREHGMFREYVNEGIKEIMGEEAAKHVILRLTQNGSAVGSALIASLFAR